MTAWLTFTACRRHDLVPKQAPSLSVLQPSRRYGSSSLAFQMNDKNARSPPLLRLDQGEASS